jgi:hypothetical protein
MTITIQEQTFGFEMEFYGVTRKVAAEAIQTVVGGYVTEFVMHGRMCWQVVSDDGRKWKVGHDSSVHPGARGGDQCEFVSPICKYDDLEKIQEIIRALRVAGAGVNDSCGIHVHVGADLHDAKSLKNLVNIMYSKQDILYRALKMHPSRAMKWARKIGPGMLDRFKKKPAGLSDIGRAWYNGDPSYHQTKYDSSRYHGLNLHSVFFTGTVEFRLFNSTTHAGRAKAYIQFCLAVSALAINSKSSRSTVTTSTNEKYTFRTWLLRLGLNGDEFKTCRHHMLANLDGNSAWRNAQ